MTRADLLKTEDGVKLIVDNWDEYLNWANEALEKIKSSNKELNSYFIDSTPLSSNKIAHMGGFKRVNNTMGIYTNDLHKHIKSLDSGAKPTYPSTYVSTLRLIDKEAQDWKSNYNEAVSTYKIARERYFLSLHKPDGTFDICKWL